MKRSSALLLLAFTGIPTPSLVKSPGVGAKGERAKATRYNPRTFPASVKAAAMKRDKGRCVQCRSTKNLEFDHKIAYAKGGTNTLKNCQVLCRCCNAAKGAR